MKILSWLTRNVPAILALALGTYQLMGQSSSIQFAAASYMVKESTALAKIVVNRSGSTTGILSVTFATLDTGGGNATPGQDYYPTNGTLTFGPGVTSKFFNLGIINDEQHETNETVILQLSNPSSESAMLVRANTTVTITDNDVCTYVLTPTSRTHGPSGGSTNFTVSVAEGCAWIAEEIADWIGIVEGSSGNGNGQVTYAYDPLPENLTTRTATILVGGRPFLVTQTRPPVDSTAPVVTIRTPAEGSRQTNSTIAVTGRATDAVGVSSVEVQLENASGTNAFAAAEGTTEWTAQVHDLVPGTNTVRVRARDAAENTGEAVRRVVYVPVSPITITKEGQGTVTPLANGQLLDVGKSYALQAKAAPGYFFTNWSGSVESTDNPLSFIMTNGLAVQAHFIPSPFTNVAGVYSGLLNEDPILHHPTSGGLTLKLGSLGTFTAKLILGGKRYSFAGRFALDGLATNSIVNGEETITVVLALDLAGASNQLSGTATTGSWTASVLAFKDVFDAEHAAPQAGRYTLLLPGARENAATEPGGTGFATIVVGTDGTAKLSGTLGDGTKVTAKAPLSGTGWLGVYIPLSGVHGSLLGWLTFANHPESDVAGTLTWFGPPRTGLRYTSGFATQTATSGSKYVPPSGEGTRVLALTNGTVSFAAGNLVTFTNTIQLSADGKTTNLGTNKLTLTIQPATGLFTGTVVPPVATKAITFKGAVHQKGSYGSGFFLGTNQTGDVQLSP
jgi:hypothetical protein